jgi:hypothetical protein
LCQPKRLLTTSETDGSDKLVLGFVPPQASPHHLRNRWVYCLNIIVSTSLIYKGMKVLSGDSPFLCFGQSECTGLSEGIRSYSLSRTLVRVMIRTRLLRGRNSFPYSLSRTLVRVMIRTRLLRGRNSFPCCHLSLEFPPNICHVPRRLYSSYLCHE